jgi:adenine-specific DNA-methyltransferase
MDKLTMRTDDKTTDNFNKLSALFPNAVTETITGYEQDDNGNDILSKPIIERAIDADVLTQEINSRVVSGKEERYQFTWPDKRKSVLAANAPIAATLRPCRKESVDFDTTENLYIEGDNLDVLKLLQETYLNRVKMIYIDPPYNTGKDFVYADKWLVSSDEWLEKSGDYDEDGNRMVKNLDSNGRFHTDWLNMIYPRLRLARDLLKDDGVIFISIDFNEFENMVKICNEVFGRTNFRNCIAVRRGIKNVQAQFDEVASLSQGHEYILLYSKSVSWGLPKLSNNFDETKAGKWDTFWRGTDRPTMRYEIFGKTPDSGQWRWERKRAYQAQENYEKYLSKFNSLMTIDDYYQDHYLATRTKIDFVRSNDEGIIQYYIPPQDGKLLSDNWMDITLSGNETVFDTEKSIELMTRIVRWTTSADDIVLDFFSGSATTAHAIMQLNAEDGGNRKFIMVQLPELCTEDSEAAKAGYKNICEIGKERIRRAGKKIVARGQGLVASKKDGQNSLFSPLDTSHSSLDTGFRVLKLDSSNMKDVYYTPQEMVNVGLDGLLENIKKDRNDEDLLFQVMLDLGIPLSARIVASDKWLVADKEKVTVFYVNPATKSSPSPLTTSPYLIACFERVTNEIVTEIAQAKPYYAVFRDSSFANDSTLVNFEQVFKTYSPTTIRKVL